MFLGGGGGQKSQADEHFGKQSQRLLTFNELKTKYVIQTLDEFLLITWDVVLLYNRKSIF